MSPVSLYRPVCEIPSPTINRSDVCVVCMCVPPHVCVFIAYLARGLGQMGAWYRNEGLIGDWVKWEHGIGMRA